MAQHMVGYGLSYRRNAFTTKIDPDGVPSRPLESLFEQAANSVKTQSNGRWLIINKDEIISSNSESTIELMVLVPEEYRARDQVIAAVAQFEEVIKRGTGIVIHETLRSIEEDGPRCQIPTCSKKPEWVRRTAFSGDHFFCATHAEAEEDFGDTSSNNMYWQHLVRVTT